MAFLLLSPFFHALSQRAPSVSTTKGIGAWVSRDSVTKEFSITSVVLNAAAAAAGLRVGDRVISVDGKSVSGMSLDEVIILLRGGPQGNPYTLAVARKIKTTLGETQKAMDLQLTPAFTSATTCLSGDCKNGEGKLVNNNTRWAYEGTFVNGTLVKGKTYFSSGRIYQSGNFKDGRVDGAGGTVYYDAADNLINQQGSFANGRIISGTFYHLASKTKYEGEWDTAGNLHGKDIIVTAPGYYFKGTYDHGKANETERMTYKSGYYDGPIVNGKPEGKGRYVEGSYIYKGHFSNGLMEGKFRQLMKSKSGNYENIFYYRAGVEQ